MVSSFLFLPSNYTYSFIYLLLFFLLSTKLTLTFTVTDSSVSALVTFWDEEEAQLEKKSFKELIYSLPEVSTAILVIKI